MKFSVSTRPLKNAVDLAVIRDNISKFNKKSTLAQITVLKNELRINLEANSVFTEITLQGSCDEPTEEERIVFVDCNIFRALIDSFEADITTIEFVDGGIILHSNSSKFNLPSIFSNIEGISLTRPTSDITEECVEIIPEDWTFVKDHQLFAISIWKTNLVYTLVYVNEDGTVLVGDIDNSIFTWTKKSNLNTTFLLNPNIINLFTVLPDHCKLYKHEKNYIVNVVTDSYTLNSEFIPDYEGDEGIGSYSADLILGTMNPSENYIEFSPVPIYRFLTQLDLVSTKEDKEEISFEVTSDSLVISNDSSKINLPITKHGEVSPYKGNFKATIFKSIFSSLNMEMVKVNPTYVEDDISGCLFYADDLKIVLGFQD